MVDRATPPTDAEIEQLRTWGVDALLVYVSGETDGGHAWDGFDLTKLEGFKLLPCYVGQNKPWTDDETTSRGLTDGDTTAQTFIARGFAGGPAVLDIEAQTYDLTPAGTKNYATSWAARVRSRAFRPIVYQPLNMAQQRAVPGAGAWVSYWTGTEEPTIQQLPLGITGYDGIGWQWSDTWHGFDASIVPESWWEGMDTTVEFASGFALAGGFRAFWQAFGGLTAFGEAISHEYDTTDRDGKPVRRQWTERAILEWRNGQYPEHYDVLPVLLGDVIRDGDTDTIDHYHIDTVQHSDAFAAKVAG